MPTFTVDTEFRRFADGLPIFVWTQDPDGRVTWANQTWYDFVALPEPLATTPAGWANVVHPDDLPLFLERRAAAVRDRTPYEWEHRVRPATGDDSSYRWIVNRTVPHFDTNGMLTHWIGTGTDVHDARLRAEERAELLAELAEKEAHAFRLIADNVPQMIWSARPDGWIDWYNQGWYDYTGQTADEAVGWGWQAVHHPDDAARLAQAYRDAMSAGQPFEDECRLRAADGSFRMFLNRATPVRNRSGEIVRWFGTNTDIDTEYRLRMRERRIAQTFQNAALQARLPDVPGIAFDAIYEPGQSDALVGGDWFDAFRLVDGRVVFSVGDVAGSGLTAAVTMGSLRQSIRTAALINPDPVAVLDAVDRIVRDMDPELLATAFVAVLDTVHGELRYASAGHPPPFVRKRDGSVTTLDAFALPLGLRQRSLAAAACIDVEPGMLLVMYTDGLTEFNRDPIAGERQAAAALRALDAHARPARALYDALIAADGPHDDIAILTVRFSDDVPDDDDHGGIRHWTFDAADAVAAVAARHDIVDLLSAGGIAADDVVSAELVFAELIGNVMRHASRTVRVALDRTGPSPVLHVLDEGKGFEHNPRLPSDLLAERGRGLYIVTHLTEELSITRRIAGGSHMRAVLTGRLRRAHACAPAAVT